MSRAECVNVTADFRARTADTVGGWGEEGRGRREMGKTT